MGNIKNLLQKSWQNAIMFVALLAMWILTGVSIWYSVIFLVFFWARSQMQLKPSSYKALSIAMLIILIIAISDAGLRKVLPRTASKKVPTIAFIDQTFSKVAPSETKVRARDIFEQNYKNASEKALDEFEALINQGKIEEADKLIRDFEEKWTYKPFQKERSSNESASNQSSQNSGSSVSNDSPGVARGDVQNLTLYKGSWYVDVRGVSSNIIIKTSAKRNAYSIEPVDGVYDYQILPAGQTVPIQDGPNVRMPSNSEPSFKIINNNARVKRIKITVR